MNLNNHLVGAQENEHCVCLTLTKLDKYSPDDESIEVTYNYCFRNSEKGGVDVDIWAYDIAYGGLTNHRYASQEFTATDKNVVLDKIFTEFTTLNTEQVKYVKDVVDYVFSKGD